MLKQNEQGYYYETEKGTYELLEGVTIGGNKEYTSDKIIIMKNGDYDKDINDELVGFLWGASSFCNNVKEYGEYVQEIIEAYENNNTIEL